MPPIESIDKAAVASVMSQANIPGVSIASVNNDGTISTERIGHTPGCVFFNRSADPTQCSFNDLKIEGQDAVILFNGELYYADQKTQEVKIIERTDSKQADFEKLEAKFTDLHQLAGPDEHTLISSITGRPRPEDVTPETVFGAASLSKTVFAYLVLKLIEANKANTAEPDSGKFVLPAGLTDFDLDTPLCKILPLKELNIEGLPKFDASDPVALANAEILTARMVLSHQTGLAHGELKFQFQPERAEPGALGTGHGYSNVGILYLQKVIEKMTETNLEVLAQKHVFGPPINMENSSFLADKSKPLDAWATNSLRTTATDYAKFVKALMNDEALQEAFIPHVYMTQDKGKAGENGPVPETALKHVAWGLGCGLQTDDDGEVVTAYHSGDMTGARAWVAMNIKDKTAMVYLSNSHNGHILAEQIMPPTIKLEHAANYFFPKWGFARNLAELGGVNNNLGLRSGPAPALDINPRSVETTQPASSGVGHGSTQQYREVLSDLRDGRGRAAASASTEESRVEDKHSITPFQITPKPKPPGEV